VDRVAQLLHGGEAEIVVADPGIDPLDPRVGGGALADTGPGAGPSRRPRVKSACRTIRPGSAGLLTDRRQAARPIPSAASTVTMPIAVNSPST
jgi:hypothetical protein